MGRHWTRRQLLGAMVAAPMVAGRPRWAGAQGGGAGEGVALAAVRLATDDDLAALAGFDLAEARHGDMVDVVLWPGDLARLRRTGLAFQVRDPDLSAADRSPDAGGGYRHLSDYEADLAGLARRFPDRVRVLTGDLPTFEGRRVLAAEIAVDVAAPDGRPTAMILGLHHAREWPSGELAMDFAREMAEGIGSDPRLAALLGAVRLLVVPVVNPDGFHHSRRSVAQASVLGAVAGGQGAYWRKNRRGVAHVGPNLASYGVDPNRNYGHQWGSGRLVAFRGTSGNPTDQSYQGPSPFSEPECENVRRWILSRAVVALITNHTYSNLVLWPWGYTRDPSPDHDRFTRLGNGLAAFNGYTAHQSALLYRTTGDTADWAYAATGALAFSMEHGDAFHPDYASTYPPLYAKNRGCFRHLLEIAAAPEHHGVIDGTVVSRSSGGGAAASLRLTRSGPTPLDPGNPSGETSVLDTIDLSMTAGDDGRFTWHVNPTAKPYQLTITAPGGTARTVSVGIRRGQHLSLGTLSP